MILEIYFWHLSLGNMTISLTLVPSLHKCQPWIYKIWVTYSIYFLSKCSFQHAMHQTLESPNILMSKSTIQIGQKPRQEVQHFLLSNKSVLFKVPDDLNFGEPKILGRSQDLASTTQFLFKPNSKAASQTKPLNVTVYN